MTVMENIVKKKLKIKISTKKVEAEPGVGSCEFGKGVLVNDDRLRDVCVNGKEKPERNKSHKFGVCASDNPKLYDVNNLKVKLPMPSSNKRGPQAAMESQMEKKQRMDHSVKQQCSSILKALIDHRMGQFFKHPVDPLAWNIPDYFSIISHPMDLGTIKTKLEDNMYFSVQEFAADIRLTFSNAMHYNPPSNVFHHMAKELDNIFNRRWKLLEAKWKRERENVEQGISNARPNNFLDTRQVCNKSSSLCVSSLPMRSMSTEEKQKLRKELVEALRGRMTENLRRFLQKNGFICQKGENIELDSLDALNDDTLWELKRMTKSSLNAIATKTESAKVTQKGGCLSLGKVVHKGTDIGKRSASVSANVKPSSNSGASKCGSCRSMTCQCSLQNDNAHASSSDVSTERLFGQDHHGASKFNTEAKSMLTSHTSKSDPDSDGAVSALDEENNCSSPQLSTIATTAASGVVWTPVIDVQLSPKKALRAAILKSRFADTILKAKQKTLLDYGDKADPVNMQLEKERLERQQREVKARIEAQIKAAEAASQMRAEAELKMQREREREAARLALQKMEKTATIDDNLEILKELEMLSGCSESAHLLNAEDGSEVVLRVTGNPLEQLGLFIKEDDDLVDEDEKVILNGDGEEGEIFS